MAALLASALLVSSAELNRAINRATSHAGVSIPSFNAFTPAVVPSYTCTPEDCSADMFDSASVYANTPQEIVQAQVVASDYWCCCDWLSEPAPSDVALRSRFYGLFDIGTRYGEIPDGPSESPDKHTQAAILDLYRVQQEIRGQIPLGRSNEQFKRPGAEVLSCSGGDWGLGCPSTTSDSRSRRDECLQVESFVKLGSCLLSPTSSTTEVSRTRGSWLECAVGVAGVGVAWLVCCHVSLGLIFAWVFFVTSRHKCSRRAGIGRSGDALSIHEKDDLRSRWEREMRSFLPPPRGPVVCGLLVQWTPEWDVESDITLRSNVRPSLLLDSGTQTCTAEWYVSTTTRREGEGRIDLLIRQPLLDCDRYREKRGGDSKNPWSQPAKLNPDDDDNDDHFGFRRATSLDFEPQDSGVGQNATGYFRARQQKQVGRVVHSGKSERWKAILWKLRPSPCGKRELSGLVSRLQSQA